MKNIESNLEVLKENHENYEVLERIFVDIVEQNTELESLSDVEHCCCITYHLVCWIELFYCDAVVVVVCC